MIEAQLADDRASTPQCAEKREYDAILIVGFGGPEKREDVLPFLENVTRGRNVPRERLLEVAEHYDHFGGASPINAQVRELIEALRPELRRHGIGLPIYWGNRNWHPMLADTMREMAGAGVKRALAVVLAAYSSYSSCRQYREDIERARDEVGPGAPAIDKTRVFYNHPEFIAANADRIREALAQVPAGRTVAVHLAFTAHSIPLAMARGSSYEMQLQESCRLVAAELGVAGKPVVARLSEPERPAPGPLARARYPRSPAAAQGAGGDGRDHPSDRLPVRSHGGALRPRRGGEAAVRGARPAHGPLQDRRHAPGLRQDAPRADRRARRAPGRRAAGHRPVRPQPRRLPRRLLPPPGPSAGPDTGLRGDANRGDPRVGRLAALLAGRPDVHQFLLSGSHATSVAVEERKHTDSAFRNRALHVTIACDLMGTWRPRGRSS